MGFDSWRHRLRLRRMQRDLQVAVISPLVRPKPFDPADHARRQQAHDELAARMLGHTDQKD